MYSARFSGPDATNASNNEKLLKEMEGKSNRAARHRVVIAFFDGKNMTCF
ncbi:MAG: non-canonical purine NTP pyrophosphatase [Bacteroidia bacterium]